MVKRLKLLLLVLMLVISICLVSINAYASSWRFEWENTLITIPVNASKEDYRNKPIAYLYRDDILLDDAPITYLTDGDWLCEFKDIDTTKLGTYYVWYKAYDNSKYKPGTCPGYKCKVTFVVKDLEAPTVTVAEEVLRIRRGSEFKPTDNVFVTDNYDDNPSIIASSDYNVNKVGSYTINVSVSDSSANTTKVSYKLEVYEDTAPKLIYKKEGTVINIPVNGTFDVAEYFEASDLVDDSSTLKIKTDKKIDLSKVSTGEYTFYVENSAGLRDEVTVTINVVDSMKPVINLTNSSITLAYDTDFKSIDYKNYIKSIEDSSEINYDNLDITYDMENIVGVYHVWYTYKNSLYEATTSLEVKLVSKAKPTIEVDDITLTVGNKVDLSYYITVTDESDPDIESKLIIYDENVDYDAVGVYYAEAYVINSSSLSTTKKFKVTILSSSSSTSSSSSNGLLDSIKSIFDSSEWIILAIILGIAVGIGVIIWQRKKNKSI